MPMKTSSALKRAIVLLSTLLFFSALCHAQEVEFTSADEFPVYGKATQDTPTRYSRLPSSFEGVSRDPLWELGGNSAGLYLRFRSDSPSIHAKWVSTPGYGMPHMTDVGDNGLDLYCLLDGKWTFVGSGFTWDGGKSKRRRLVGNMEPGMREYMLYLSLYDGVDSLYLGVEKGYALYQPLAATPSTKGPVVAYGTSILQGGCASRPGMAHTAILSRRLDREIINLGFSGNARLDYEIAELIASVENPSLVILDYVPNSGADEINERGRKFFDIIRSAHPKVPVILVEDPIFPHSVVDREILKEVTGKNKAQRSLYESLRRDGVKGVYYVGAEGMMGDDGEATVDGIHLTDLGMVRYVDHIMPTVKKALKWRGR